MTIDEIENILLSISDKENDIDNAYAAFDSLFKEYSRYLGKVVNNALKNMGIYDEDLFNTIINNTFLVVYEKPLKFNFRKEAQDDKSFKAWLATIAHNELKQLLQEYFSKESEISVVINEKDIESTTIPEEIVESINNNILQSALATLSERDRHILMTLYLYYEKDKDTPSDVLDLLCKMHKTTKSNIRQIKRRSENKIIEYFEKHSDLKPLKNAK